MDLAGVVAGVIGGLITAAILVMVGFVWRDKLDPWLSDKRYRGVRIDGNWKLSSEPSDGDGSEFAHDETLEVEQKASRLIGRLILVPSSGSTGVTRTLVLEGSIRDRFVLFTAVPASHQALGFTAFLGQVEGDGAKLRGGVVYFDTGVNQIRSARIGYRKQLSS